MEAWREELYLSHHGLAGQKWGQRNGPPYPLSYNQHSAAQKQLNLKSDLDNYERKTNPLRNKTKAQENLTKKHYTEKLIKNNAKASQERIGFQKDLMKAFSNAKAEYQHKNTFFGETETKYNDIKNYLNNHSYGEITYGEDKLDAIDWELKKLKELIVKMLWDSLTENPSMKMSELNKMVDNYVSSGGSVKQFSDSLLKLSKKPTDNIFNTAGVALVYLDTYKKGIEKRDKEKEELEKKKAAKDKATDNLSDAVYKTIDVIDKATEKVSDVLTGEQQKKKEKEELKKKFDNTIKHSDELYHHGIDGQKWGKRNGPPYPLNPGDHSAAEIKANKKFQSDVKKLDNLNKRISKKLTKADKYTVKRSKAQVKEYKKTYGAFANENKAGRARQKSMKYDFKSKKAIGKAVRMSTKYQKILNELNDMTKEYGWEVADEYISKGKEYVRLSNNIKAIRFAM